MPTSTFHVWLSNPACRVYPCEISRPNGQECSVQLRLCKACLFACVCVLRYVICFSGSVGVRVRARVQRGLCLGGFLVGPRYL